MTFRTLDRVVYRLVIGSALSSCVLSAPLASAALSARGALGQNSAPKSAAVEDVQRILAEDKGKPDAEVAGQLSGLVLRERMSDATLKSLGESLPGTMTRSALVALADASVFLGSAAADVLSLAPPDLNHQRRMIAMTVDYLGKTLPKLPDFYAERTTIRYDGDLRSVRGAGATSQDDSSWREVGASRVVVTYRDGREVIDTRGWGKYSPEDKGLITRGTFGPMLSTVIVDAARGEMRWDHWERVGAGTLAVFHYSVPQNRSHYSVAFQGPSSDMPSSDMGDTENATGYHGEVAIDPATGTILRLTVQADPAFGSPVFRGDIMVEYGPVEIGGKTYTCPIRSVSISLTSTGLLIGMGPFGRPAHNPEDTLLNDVTFDDYHQFRSDSRILTGDIPAPHP